MLEPGKQLLKLNQAYLDLVNQVFEIEKKANAIRETHSIHRNVNKIKSMLEDGFFVEAGLTYHNPIGESYNETRTDCDATIAGTSVNELVISEVIKPIIYFTCTQDGNTIKMIAQKAVVIVQSTNEVFNSSTE